MTYRIARNGETLGPYSLLQVQRHLASGEIVATDLAQSEAMEEWLPVSELFPASAMKEGPEQPSGSTKLFPDPPDLNWVVVLMLALVTLNVFSVVWDLYQSVWIRRVERTSIAVWFYAALALVFILKAPETWQSILHNLGRAPAPSGAGSVIFTVLTIVFAISSRLVFRRELLRHFNRTERVGLSLNWLLSLLFGGIYFQYHFNRINGLKRSLRISVPRG